MIDIFNLDKGELVLISGRPASGKSTIALHMAYEFMMKNREVLFINLENPNEVIDERIKMVTKSEEECTLIKEKVLNLKNDISLEKLKEIILKHKHSKYIFIDYAQLINHDFSGLLVELKKIVEDNNLTLIVISQLSRGWEVDDKDINTYTDVDIEENILDMAFYLYKKADNTVKIHLMKKDQL